ncbi:MAG: hypothetical protein R6U95_06320 [Bacteroidales bacterium]
MSVENRTSFMLFHDFGGCRMLLMYESYGFRNTTSIIFPIDIRLLLESV